MSFNDVFKSGFVEKVSAFSIIDMVIALGLSFIIGLFILYVYKKTYNGVMYSKGFAVSLLAMTLITSLIILAISSNVVLSLGMVGALSIVRFRSAIKEPMDIAFLFWSISVGIVTGAGIIPLAVFGSIIIGAVLLVFSNKTIGESPYLLVVNCDTDEVENLVTVAVGKNVNKYIVKSKTVSPSGIELTLEVRLKEATTGFVNMVAQIKGVENAVLVSYNGDYMS